MGRILEKKVELDDDTIILIGGLGAALTAYGAAKGAAEVVDTLMDTVQDAENLTKVSPKNPILKALGYGKKGGLL